MKARIARTLAASLLFAFALGAAYYATAWRAARAAAISVVLGEPTVLGPSDPSWGEPLADPNRDDLVVKTAGDWFELSRDLSFNFTLRNERLDTRPVPLGVVVELTSAGWVVVGYGSGG